MIALSVVAAVALAMPGAKPQRIVSLNVCTDQLLLQLVDRGRIASVTDLAADPELSIFAGRAQGLPLGRATAEEVILLRPDLALAGEYGAREAVEVLRRWGIPVLEFAPAESWEDIREQLGRAGAALGEPEKARALIAQMDASLNALESRRPARELRGILLQHDGGTLGSGTLMDEILRAAGFRNLASEWGTVGYGSISLERLLVSQPNLVIVPAYHPNVPTLGGMYLRHPALHGQSFGRLELPAAEFFCGTTETVRAVRRLVEWRERAASGARR